MRINWKPYFPSPGGDSQGEAPRLLVAGDKSGVKEGRFYKELIGRADARFDAHLARLRKEGG